MARRVVTVFALAAFGGIVPASARAPEVQRSSCAGTRSGELAGSERAPRSILAIRSASSSGATLLGRLNGLSLRPVSRQLRIGEYHDAWSRSPDGAKLALGLSMGGHARRVGIGIADLASLRIVRGIPTGIAAEAVGWLAPRRLAAGLQDGRLVLVDPMNGRTLREVTGAGEPRRFVRAGRRLVVLFADVTASGPVRIAVADARGRLRSTTLDRIRLRTRTVGGRPYADAAGLAVDPSRGLAYVAAAGAPIAVVALDSMHVSYHRVDGLRARAAAYERQRSALWLGGARFAVYGHDVVSGRRGRGKVVPGGVVLVDSRAWRSCALDSAGSGVAVGGGRLLVYGTRGSSAPGLRVYTRRWRRVRALLREPVWDVKIARRYAYARTPSTVRVVDAVSGRVLERIARPPELVDVVGG